MAGWCWVFVTGGYLLKDRSTCTRRRGLSLHPRPSLARSFTPALHGGSAMPEFRGKPACDCLAKWLPVYEAELLARGLLAPGKSLTVYQLIGGAPQSGGTHSTGGAFDLLDLPGVHDVGVARDMGADATWSRPKGWDGAAGIAHIHGVLRGCPHNGPARYQITAVDAGFNGLGKGGMGARDDGPRPLSGRTWQQGLAWQKQQARKRAITATILKLRARIGRLKAKRGAL